MTVPLWKLKARSAHTLLLTSYRPIGHVAYADRTYCLVGVVLGAGLMVCGTWSLAGIVRRKISGRGKGAIARDRAAAQIGVFDDNRLA